MEDAKKKQTEEIKQVKKKQSKPKKESNPKQNKVKQPKQKKKYIFFGKHFIFDKQFDIHSEK